MTLIPTPQKRVVLNLTRQPITESLAAAGVVDFDPHQAYELTNLLFGSTPTNPGDVFDIAHKIGEMVDKYFGMDTEPDDDNGAPDADVFLGSYDPRPGAIPTWLLPTLDDALFSGCIDTHYEMPDGSLMEFDA